MHAELGWFHPLGARGATGSLEPIWDGLDYASYEQHRPDYATYVTTIDRRTDKPAFSEDRFRMRDEGRAKDYTMEDTRRGLWRSTMAGGVANIWGNVIGVPEQDRSEPYPDPEAIRTWSRFFQHRFLPTMVRDNGLTDGVCLRTPEGDRLVFYKEDAASIRIDLGDGREIPEAIAVDTKKPYEEIPVANVDSRSDSWITPYRSDWAVAVGPFPAPLEPTPQDGPVSRASAPKPAGRRPKRSAGCSRGARVPSPRRDVACATSRSCSPWPERRSA
jgi:hypothetical protein